MKPALRLPKQAPNKSKMKLQVVLKATNHHLKRRKEKLKIRKRANRMPLRRTKWRNSWAMAWCLLTVATVSTKTFSSRFLMTLWWISGNRLQDSQEISLYSQSSLFLYSRRVWTNSLECSSQTILTTIKGICSIPSPNSQLWKNPSLDHLSLTPHTYPTRTTHPVNLNPSKIR